MKLIRAAAMIALMISPFAGLAHAQTPNVNLIPETKSKNADELEQDRIAEKAYRESLRKIPDTKAPSDPWGTVRSTDTPKPAAAKPRVKTGNSTN